MRWIYIATIGSVPPGCADSAEQAVWRVFGADTRRIALDIREEDALDGARRQYNSVMILREIRKLVPPDALKLLALTERDLFIPMLSFVFGQAQLEGAAAIVSVARLRQEFYGLPPDPALTGVRTAKEAIHEVGHTFGLTHCHDPSCPMSIANSVLHADRKGTGLCASCRAVLGERLVASSIM
jgi:archaemetzincin